MTGGVGARRCQHPRKVRGIEVDRGKIIRFEVGDIRARFGAHDQTLIETDHIGRSVECQVNVARNGGHTGAVLLGLQLQANLDARARLQRAVRCIWIRVRTCQSAARPWHEAIRNGHAGSSTSSTT